MKMLLRFTASTVLALIMGTACDGQHYARINLVSSAGRTAQVYYTAGSSHGSGGLFGYLVAVPMEPQLGFSLAICTTKRSVP